MGDDRDPQTRSLNEGYGQSKTGFESLVNQRNDAELLEFLRKLIPKSSSEKEYARHKELAVRAAIGVLILGLGFILPPGTIGIADAARANGLLTPTCVGMFIFTVYKTTGATFELAWAGIIGTVWADMTAYVMRGLVPGGVQDTGDWLLIALGWFVAVATTWFAIWLDVDMNARIFYLSTYVWHWMRWMDPGSYDANVANRWFIILKRPVVQESFAAI